MSQHSRIPLQAPPALQLSQDNQKHAYMPQQNQLFQQQQSMISPLPRMSEIPTALKNVENGMPLGPGFMPTQLQKKPISPASPIVLRHPGSLVNQPMMRQVSLRPPLQMMNRQSPMPNLQAHMQRPPLNSAPVSLALQNKAPARSVIDLTKAPSPALAHSPISSHEKEPDIEKVFYVENPTYMRELLKQLDKQRSSGEMTDVLIRVQDKLFKAHSCILTAGSEWFGKYFKTATKLKRAETIELPAPHDADGFSRIIDYMYTGRLVISKSTVLKVLMLACYLSVPYIMEKCKEFMNAPSPAMSPSMPKSASPLPVQNPIVLKKPLVRQASMPTIPTTMMGNLRAPPTTSAHLTMLHNNPLLRLSNIALAQAGNSLQSGPVTTNSPTPQVLAQHSTPNLSAPKPQLMLTKSTNKLPLLATAAKCVMLQQQQRESDSRRPLAKTTKSPADTILNGLIIESDGDRTPTDLHDHHSPPRAPPRIPTGLKLASSSSGGQPDFDESLNLSNGGSPMPMMIDETYVDVEEDDDDADTQSLFSRRCSSAPAHFVAADDFELPYQPRRPASVGHSPQNREKIIPMKKKSGSQILIESNRAMAPLSLPMIDFPSISFDPEPTNQLKSVSSSHSELLRILSMKSGVTPTSSSSSTSPTTSKLLNMVIDGTSRPNDGFDRMLKPSRIFDFPAAKYTKGSDSPPFSEANHILNSSQLGGSAPLPGDDSILAGFSSRLTSAPVPKPKKEFPCSYCGKIFGRQQHLKRHILTHTGERPFPCIHCDKRFRRSEHLKHHHGRHHPDKPKIIIGTGRRGRPVKKVAEKQAQFLREYEEQVRLQRQLEAGTITQDAFNRNAAMSDTFSSLFMPTLTKKEEGLGFPLTKREEGLRFPTSAPTPTTTSSASLNFGLLGTMPNSSDIISPLLRQPVTTSATTTSLANDIANKIGEKRPFDTISIMRGPATSRIGSASQLGGLLTSTLGPSSNGQKRETSMNSSGVDIGSGSDIMTTSPNSMDLTYPKPAVKNELCDMFLENNMKPDKPGVMSPPGSLKGLGSGDSGYPGTGGSDSMRALTDTAKRANSTSELIGILQGSLSPASTSPLFATTVTTQSDPITTDLPGLSEPKLEVGVPGTHNVSLQLAGNDNGEEDCRSELQRLMEALADKKRQ